MTSGIFFRNAGFLYEKRKDSIIVSFGGSIFSGATFNTAVNLKDGHTSSFKGGSFGSELRAYIEGHALYPVREDAFPLSII